MSYPIQATSTLYGKEAKAFIKTIKENENKLANKEDVLRSIRIYLSVMKNNPNFNF